MVIPGEGGEEHLAFAVALIGTSAFLPVAWWVLKRWTVLDHPNERSSHARPTPRGGGLAQIVGAVAALGVLAPPVGAVVGVLSFGTLGAVDDFRSLSVRFRLAAQLGISGVVGILLWPTASPFSLWILVASVVVLPLTVNAVNFMDGINGISAANGIVFGLSYAWIFVEVGVPSWSSIAMVLVGISVAFLPWNWRRHAPLFLGDSGSYLMGCMAGLFLMAVLSSGSGVLVAVVPLAVYLADVLSALVHRLRRRQSLLQAHRSHTYQRLVDAGWTHRWTAVFVASCSLVCGMIGVAMASTVLPMAVGVVVVTGVICLYLATPLIGRWFASRDTA